MFVIKNLYFCQNSNDNNRYILITIFTVLFMPLVSNLHKLIVYIWSFSLHIVFSFEPRLKEMLYAKKCCGFSSHL